MTINKFLSLHRVKLQPGVREACNYGLDYMSHATDLMHNQHHPQRILDDLHRMRTECSEINWPKVDFNVLLLSICWHDTWVSRFDLKNKRKGAFGRLYEGIGSMRILNRKSKQLMLDPKVIKKVKYAIRKHSYLQFMPRLTIESKILHDLDKLEEWSIKRLYLGMGSVQSLLSFTPNTIHLYKFYFEHVMLKKNFGNYTYDWSKKQFVIRKKLFLKEVSRIFSELANLLLHPQPTASSLLADKN